MCKGWSSDFLSFYFSDDFRLRVRCRVARRRPIGPSTEPTDRVGRKNKNKTKQRRQSSASDPTAATWSSILVHCFHADRFAKRPIVRYFTVECRPKDRMGSPRRPHFISAALRPPTNNEKRPPLRQSALAVPFTTFQGLLSHRSKLPINFFYTLKIHLLDRRVLQTMPGLFWTSFYLPRIRYFDRPRASSLLRLCYVYYFTTVKDELYLGLKKIS